MNPEKEKVVAKLTQTFQNHPVLIFTDFTGYKALDFQKLRVALRREGAGFVIVKNRLSKRAAEAAARAEILSFLEGPTGIAFQKEESPAAAKILVEESKANSALKIRGGLFKKKTLSSEEVEELASLPSREVLLSKLAYLLSAPLQRLLRALTWEQRKLVMTLKAIQEKKGG